MRPLQNLLFVIGATSVAFAIAAGFAFVMGLIVFPSGRDSGGAVVAFMILAAIGGVIGGIIGFVVSLRRIAERKPTPWSVGTWIGLVAGLITGWLVVMSNVLDNFVLGSLLKWPPATTVFMIALALSWRQCGRIRDVSGHAALKLS